MDNKPYKICFLADRHSLYDDRIYWKEGLSLLRNGYEVHFLLLADEIESGVTKEGIYYQKLKRKAFHKNRLINFIFRKLSRGNIYNELFEKAARLKADAYHIQDLRVNSIGPKLKKLTHQPKIVYELSDLNNHHPANT